MPYFGTEPTAKTVDTIYPGGPCTYCDENPVQGACDPIPAGATPIAYLRHGFPLRWFGFDYPHPCPLRNYPSEAHQRADAIDYRTNYRGRS